MNNINDLYDRETINRLGKYIEIIRNNTESKYIRPTIFEMLNELEKFNELSVGEKFLVAYMLGYGEHARYIHLCLNSSFEEKDRIVINAYRKSKN